MYPWESRPKREDPTVIPEVDMQIQYVPSYNGRTARNNILFVNENEIVFTVNNK